MSRQEIKDFTPNALDQPIEIGKLSMQYFISGEKMVQTTLGHSGAHKIKVCIKHYNPFSIS